MKTKINHGLKYFGTIILNNMQVNKNKDYLYVILYILLLVFYIFFYFTVFTYTIGTYFLKTKIFPYKIIF